MRLVNLGLLWGGAFLAGSGFLLAYRLPHGPAGRGLTALGMDRHEWAELHEICAWCVVACVILHLAMNWNWVRVVANRKTVWRAAAGLGVTAVLIFGIWFQPVHASAPGEREEHGQGQGRGPGWRS